MGVKYVGSEAKLPRSTNYWLWGLNKLLAPEKNPISLSVKSVTRVPTSQGFYEGQ